MAITQQQRLDIAELYGKLYGSHGDQYYENKLISQFNDWLRSVPLRYRLDLRTNFNRAAGLPRSPKADTPGSANTSPPFEQVTTLPATVPPRRVKIRDLVPGDRIDLDGTKHIVKSINVFTNSHGTEWTVVCEDENWRSRRATSTNGDYEYSFWCEPVIRRVATPDLEIGMVMHNCGGTITKIEAVTEERYGRVATWYTIHRDGDLSPIRNASPDLKWTIKV